MARNASGSDIVTSDRPVAPNGAVSWYAEGFSDRLGDRLLLFDNAGPGLELLRFSPTLTAVDGFEGSVRARIEQCASFTHPSFARVRSLTVLDDPHPQLALVSEHAPGERVSSILRSARQAGTRLRSDSAIWLLRQVTPALAALQDLRPGSAHGCLTPDRIVLTPMGDAILTEYALAPALERLNLDRSGLWREFGILAGRDGAPALLGPRVDVAQLGLITIALLLGRPLRSDDLPAGLSALVDRACGAPDVACTNLRQWIERALGIATPAFADAREASEALDVLMPGVTGRWTPAPLPDAGTMSQALAPRSRLTTLGLGRDEALARPPRALPAPKGDPVIVARRLRRVSIALGTVAFAEAAALIFLLTRPPQAVIALPAPGESAAAVSAPQPAPAADDAVAAGSREHVAGRSGGHASAAPAVATVGSIREAAGSATAATALGVATDAALPGAPAVRSVIGWLAVDSDVELRVYANGRLLGSAARGRFRLPAGDHDIMLVNDAIGLRSTQPVRVVAGRTALVPAPTH